MIKNLTVGSERGNHSHFFAQSKSSACPSCRKTMSRSISRLSRRCRVRPPMGVPNTASIALLDRHPCFTYPNGPGDTQLSADAKPSGLMATVSQKAYQGKPSLEIFGVSGEMAMNECGCMGVWVGGWTKQITHSIPEFRTWHSENVKIGWRQEHHQRLPLLLAVCRRTRERATKVRGTILAGVVAF